MIVLALHCSSIRSTTANNHSSQLQARAGDIHTNCNFPTTTFLAINPKVFRCFDFWFSPSLANQLCGTERDTFVT